MCALFKTRTDRFEQCAKFIARLFMTLSLERLWAFILSPAAAYGLKRGRNKWAYRVIIIHGFARFAPRLFIEDGDDISRAVWWQSGKEENASRREACISRSLDVIGARPSNIYESHIFRIPFPRHFTCIEIVEDEKELRQMQIRHCLLCHAYFHLRRYWLFQATNNRYIL